MRGKFHRRRGGRGRHRGRFRGGNRRNKAAHGLMRIGFRL